MRESTKPSIHFHNNQSAQSVKLNFFLNQIATLSLVRIATRIRPRLFIKLITRIYNLKKIAESDLDTFCVRSVFNSIRY